MKIVLFRNNYGVETPSLPEMTNVTAPEGMPRGGGGTEQS
jgi:hypothetical protein